MIKYNEPKKDCFGYSEKDRGCRAMKELYCMKSECKFYRTDINWEDIKKACLVYGGSRISSSVGEKRGPRKA